MQQEPVPAGAAAAKIQILTVENLIAGKRIQHFELAFSNVKQGEKRTKEQQLGLF